MRKIIYTKKIIGLLLLIIFSKSINAQWVKQNTGILTGVPLNSIYAASATNVYLAGNNG